MKKNVALAALTMLCAGFGMNVSAQDVILTKDMDIIKAYVHEITDDTVSYTKASNPDGPIYKIATSKLLKINFENGTEDVFSTQQAAAPQQNDATSQSSQVNMESNAVSPQAAEKMSGLDSSRGNVLLNGRKLSIAEIEVLMPYDLYAQVRKGQKMRKTGKGLLIPGAILTGLGTVFIMAACANPTEHYYNGYEDVAYSPDPVLSVMGGVSYFVGVPLLATGIPLFCVGQGKVRRAVNAYNEGYSGEYSFNVGSTRNGFGLYLNF